MYMTKQQIMNQLAERNNGFLLTSDVVTAGISKTSPHHRPFLAEKAEAR